LTQSEPGWSPRLDTRPSFIVSHELPLAQAPEGYRHFDARDEGWTKIVLKPGG